jgi:lipoprotein-anchoring transpeptidase ErfK/SrfK
VLVGGVTAGAVMFGGGTAKKGPSPAQVAQQKAQEAHAQAVVVELAQAQLLSGIKISPAAGTSGVALDVPVTVTAGAGALRSVQISNGAGAVLTGSLSTAGTTWKYSGALQPSSTYHVVATVAGAGGVTAKRTSTFTTLTPAAQVTATVYPTTDMSVGVGQPVVVMFDHYIDTAASQQAVLSHFTISMSKPVPGGWHWFSQDELHFRPEAYWPANEKITVTANLNGWDAGGGRWGAGQITDSFTTGAARISYANLQTEEMTVTLNGATIATYPISGGRPEYPTMDGDHIVLDRQSVVHMVSSTVGIPVKSANGYDEYVYDDVHISDSGEYVHAAPWSVGAQGVTNVSHGCVNLSTANALNFFDFSRVGDVVVVTGSPRPAAYGDHGVMDWGTAWSQWTAAKVVSTAAPTTTTSTTATTAPPVVGAVSTTTATTRPTAVTTTPTG